MQREPGRRGRRLLLMSVIGGVLLTTATVLSARPIPDRKRPLPPKEPFQSTLKRVNQQFDRAIAQAGLASVSPADWLTQCRRLNLALVGCSLSLEDVRRLEQMPEADRTNLWLEHLLQDPRSADYVSERLTRAFVGTHQGPFLLFRRRKFQLWLAEQLAQNRPYDQIVRSILTANGLWTDQPQVNFLTATMDENDNGRADPIRLAGRTSRAFLGMRIDCLQCHDDFLDKIDFGPIESNTVTFNTVTSNRVKSHTMVSDAASSDKVGTSKVVPGTQRHFHELAAFFSGASLSQGNVFRGIRDDDQTYRFKFLNTEQEQEVPACPPFLADLIPVAGNARVRLAAWLTHRENKAFARATVNRFWALLFGKPLMEPVDDLPLNGPFAPGLEVLADDFAEHGYDLQRLLRLLVRSDAFQRDSATEAFAITSEHERAWAVFPLTQLRPEQVAGSIHQSARLKTIDEESSILAELEKFGYVNDFLKAHGDSGEDEFDAQSVTIPQRLLVMNGRLVRERTEPNPVANASTRIAALAPTARDALTTAYLATLNRYPNQEELDSLTPMLEETRGEARSQAMSDVYWILINSTEFLWNH